MAVVLAATMRLGLASRQNTGDQKAILRVQYAAESNLALMRSQIKDFQTLLSTNSIVVPPGTLPATAEAWGLTFCGNSASWTPTDDYKVARDKADNTLYPDAQQCFYTKSADANQFNVLGILVPDAAFGILPATPVNERPAVGVSARTTWWKNKLDTTLAIGQGNYKISPIKAVKLDGNTFRYYVKVSQLSAQGVDAGTSRILAGGAAQSGVWWFQLELPNLLKHVLMTNHHRSEPSSYSPTGVPTLFFTGNQNFDGPVFTNEKFLFDASSKAKFLDSVSSAGCIDLPKVGEPSAANKDCNHQAGVYTDDAVSGLTSSGANWNKDATLDVNTVNNINKVLLNKVNTHTNKGVNFNGVSNSPNFVAQYKALPTNSTDQKELGLDVNGGITLPNDATGLLIYAGDSFEGSLKTYSDGKWLEPSPTYQYIAATKSGAIVDSSRYRIDSNGNIFKYDAVKKQWPTTGLSKKFNGMVYSEASSAIAIQGPSRLKNSGVADTSGDLKYAPPALASFSNMTVTSVRGMKIQTDLTMSDTPCGNSDVINNNCQKDKPQNVLGLFSPSGDIAIDTAAPNNINIHSAMLTSSGSIEVSSYNAGSYRGIAKVTGSVLENFYGPFFTFDPYTGKTKTGYQRDFRWDPRFNEGITPRGFPVSPTWNSSDSASSQLRLDNLTWKQGVK